MTWSAEIPPHGAPRPQWSHPSPASRPAQPSCPPFGQPDAPKTPPSCIPDAPRAIPSTDPPLCPHLPQLCRALMLLALDGSQGSSANGRLRKELAHITRLRDQHRLSPSRLGQRATLNRAPSLSTDDTRTWIPAARDTSAPADNQHDLLPGISDSMEMSRGASRMLGTAGSRRMGTSSHQPMGRLQSGARAGTSPPREGSEGMQSLCTERWLLCLAPRGGGDLLWGTQLGSGQSSVSGLEFSRHFEAVTAPFPVWGLSLCPPHPFSGSLSKLSRPGVSRPRPERGGSTGFEADSQKGPVMAHAKGPGMADSRGLPLSVRVDASASFLTLTSRVLGSPVGILTSKPAARPTRLDWDKAVTFM